MNLKKHKFKLKEGKTCVWVKNNILRNWIFNIFVEKNSKQIWMWTKGMVEVKQANDCARKILCETVFCWYFADSLDDSKEMNINFGYFLNQYVQQIEIKMQNACNFNDKLFSFNSHFGFENEIFQPLMTLNQLKHERILFEHCGFKMKYNVSAFSNPFANWYYLCTAIY